MSTFRPKQLTGTPRSIWHPSWSTALPTTATSVGGASRQASAAMTPRSIWHPSWSTATSTAPTKSADSKAESMNSPPSPPRSRKKIGCRSSLEFLDGGHDDTVAPRPPSRASKGKRNLRRAERRMSPEGKTKLDALLNLTDATDYLVFDEDADEITTSAVPEVKAAGHTKKRVVATTAHAGESTSNLTDKTEKRTPNEEVVRSVGFKSRSSSQVTPKANAANKSKHSPIPSFSPIDYRPLNHHANGAECPETSSMLKSYVEKWTKPSSDDNDDYLTESNDQSRFEDRKHSSIVADSSDERDNVPSPSAANEDLDVEYGRLALLKQELERKIQERALDVTRAHGGVAEASERLNPLLGQQFSTMNDRKDGMAPSTTGTREGLEHEYGQLTFFKRQLERKLQMQSFDAKASSPDVKSVTNDDVMAIRREGITRHDETPTREDVEFGEMVYQQRMAELKRFDLQGSSTDDDGYAATKYDGNGGRENSLPSHRGVRTRGVAKYRPDHFDENHDTAYDRSFSNTKTKKRRKRRVVETITRVIHEESEEEGSASTGGDRHETGRSFSLRDRHGDDRHTGYREPSNHRRGRFFSPKMEAHELRNPGRDYNAYDESGSDSSQGFVDDERRPYQTKWRSRKRKKAPRREK
ncbi:hypothetical protein ACHAXA_001839 [Cyclostephanos tholiformis]|uniref:Uncharacterized protein n=1 Tax=Cyclostephanos tholiformis TaxID=382380 RepID=A0ABD3R0S0_9STRA